MCVLVRVILGAIYILTRGERATRVETSCTSTSRGPRRVARVMRAERFSQVNKRGQAGSGSTNINFVHGPSI